MDGCHIGDHEMDTISGFQEGRNEQHLYEPKQLLAASTPTTEPLRVGQATSRATAASTEKAPRCCHSCLVGRVAYVVQCLLLM